MYDPLLEFLYDETLIIGGECIVKKIVYNPWIACATLIAAVGVCWFCAQLLIAISNYRGPTGRSYAITEQYLSDLGMRGSNVRNEFNQALMVLGASWIPFFMLIPGSDPKESIWVKLIGLSGFIAAMGLIGLGATPADYELHRMMLVLWAAAMPTMFVCCLFGAVGNRVPMSVLILCLSIAVAAAAAILIFLSRGNTFVLQKIVVGISLAWVPLLLWFVIKSNIRVVFVRIQRSEEEDISNYTAKLRVKHYRD